jgi:hypothetical protein
MKKFVKISTTEDILNDTQFPREELQKHNAFPDAVFFNGKEYLIFRSARLHIPSRKSVLLLCSRKDSEPWHIENIFREKNADVRDPKLIIFQNTLHLYYSVVNKNPRNSIMCIMHTVQNGDATWTVTEQVYKTGYLLGRIRNYQKKLYMTVYQEWDTHQFAGLQCAIVTSNDGIHWTNKTDYGILTSEGTESDCLPLSPTTLLWIIRNDMGKTNPVGTNIYLVDNTGHTLLQRFHKIKYDAPLLIKKQDNIYILSRLPTRFKGTFALVPRRLPRVLQNTVNVSTYIMTPKTTALSILDLPTLTLKTIATLDTFGDTGYCSYAQNGDHSYIYTYSSDTRRPKMSWLRGQMMKTSIYKYEVEFTP